MSVRLFFVGAILLVAFFRSCRRHELTAPIVIHVHRDPSAKFSSVLRNSDIQFTLTKPQLSNGRPMMVATNEGDSFPRLMQCLKDAPPELLILNSETEFPSDINFRNLFGKPEFVCGGKPAYVLGSQIGEEREATEIYLRFLKGHCGAPHSSRLAP